MRIDHEASMVISATTTVKMLKEALGSIPDHAIVSVTALRDNSWDEDSIDFTWTTSHETSARN